MFSVPTPANLRDCGRSGRSEKTSLQTLAANGVVAHFTPANADFFWPEWINKLALEQQDNKMGLTQIVQFPTSHAPCWPAVRDLLAAHKCVLQVRMIDGELAFLDEEPGENWRELRLATPEGLALTVKRDSARVELIIWGNADPTLIRAWNALTWAFAETGQGVIRAESGEQTPSEYLNHAELPWKPCASG